MRAGYHTMKRRLGGEKLTPREKLLLHTSYPCPGCLGHHTISKFRQEILFDHYEKRPQKSWIVYWRSHPAEHQASWPKQK